MKFKLLDSDKQKTFAEVLNSGDEAMKRLLTFAKQQQLKASRLLRSLPSAKRH